MDRKETSDFWVGIFNNQDDFYAFVGENPDYYNEDDGSETKYISTFAESQGQGWIDHDFMEVGYNSDETDFATRFTGHSYADQWISEIAGRVSSLGLGGVNAIIMVTKGLIKEPKSVVRDNFVLTHVGNVEYPI